MKRRAYLRMPALLCGLVAILALLSVGGCGAGATGSTSRAPKRTAGIRLYVNPDTPAAVQASLWQRSGDRADASLIERIARQPTAQWLTGGSQPAPQVVSEITAAAARKHALAQFVVYDIPDRDCGGYSSGGAPTSSAYLSWLQAIVGALNQQAAVVILEPDAVAQAASGCLGAAGAQSRYLLLAAAGKLLARDRHARVYVDAGSAGWVPAQQMAGPLQQSGVATDSGFALNVANFYTQGRSIAYGGTLSRLLKGKHFVIDTSRNGKGAPQSGAGVSHWCNPAGRALGQAPTLVTGHSLVDAFLWIKYPGESDGTCSSGDPAAGAWWPSYALGLVRGDSP